MMAVEQQQALWLVDEQAPLVTDSLATAIRRRCDVVVIGAGIAGLSAALTLLQSGRSVCVIEARAVGEGTSALATAKVTSAHGDALARIAHRRGFDAAVSYQRMNDAGFQWIADLVGEAQHEVGWTPAEHLIYTSANDTAFERSATVAAVAGSSPRTVASPYWSDASAVTWGHSALVHPVKLLRLMAAQARLRGAILVEGVRALDIRSDEHGVDVRVAHGGFVRADQALLATQVPFSDPSLLVPRLSYTWHAAMAAPVSSQTVPTSLDVEEHGISTRPATLSSGDEVAVIVGPRTAPEDMASGRAWNELASTASRLLGTGPALFKWSAHDAVAPGLLPLLRHQRGDSRVWIITGMNGWGFTNAAALALQLPRLLTSGDWSPSTSMSAQGALESAASVATAGLTSAKALFEGHVRSFAHATPVAMPSGSGAVFGGPLHPQAVCRTVDGRLHSVSARCTHAGCIVDWNPMAQSWECPCHGSKFDPDGGVISGPATRPLPATPTPPEL